MINLTRAWWAFVCGIIAITVAEAVTSFLDPSCGMVCHMASLVALIALATFRYGNRPMSNLFLSLALAPLIRITSLALPLAAFPPATWYIVASVPVLIAALAVMWVQGLGLRDVGLVIQRPLLQVGAVVMGVLFGVVEYAILRPAPLAPGLSIVEVAALAVAVVFTTGFVEELVFRGVLQQHATNILGHTGILGVAVVFAVLHIGWLSIFDVLFVFLIGLFFGYLRLTAGSIVGASLSHGVVNVMLFFVMPAVMG